MFSLLSALRGTISSGLARSARTMNQPAPNLDELRRRLDALDDRIHDLVMERAELVESVASFKQSAGQPSLRPGREARILRRLVARHRGKLPRQTLVRLWRELLGGTVSMQGKFAVAVAVPEARTGFWDIARDHFGGYVSMIPLRSSAEVLSAVGDGRASVGVLPVPFNNETAPWWPSLAGARAQGPRVLARLPFAGAGNGRDGDGDALVVGKGDADASGADRSMLVIEASAEMSRARLIAAFDAVGRPANHVAAHQLTPDECWHLVEVDGLASPQDPVVAAALKTLGDQGRGFWVLGCYAQPLPPDNK
jgi:chorismate mutase-like protein